MSYGYLSQMLEYLTGAYNRSDIRNDKHSLPMETNIGKLFGTFAWGLELIHEHSDRMLLWDDIDNAQGAVLDRYGANFGVSRGGANDAFYRLLIKIKMISMLSGGDIDTIIKAAANLFNVQASDIEVRELFPAKIWLYVDEDILDAERLEASDLIAELMKRIFLRTYHNARTASFLAVAALESATVTARVRVSRNFKGTVRSKLSMPVWEDTIITAKTRR